MERSAMREGHGYESPARISLRAIRATLANLARYSVSLF
jgi:hypothetical protein